MAFITMFWGEIAIWLNRESSILHFFLCYPFFTFFVQRVLIVMAFVLLVKLDLLNVQTLTFACSNYGLNFEKSKILQMHIYIYFNTNRKLSINTNHSTQSTNDRNKTLLDSIQVQMNRMCFVSFSIEWVCAALQYVWFWCCVLLCYFVLVWVLSTLRSSSCFSFFTSLSFA